MERKRISEGVVSDGRFMLSESKEGNDLPHFKMLIGGKLVSPVHDAYFPTENPFDGLPWAMIPRGSPDDVHLAAEAASNALTNGPWGKWSATQRGKVLRKLADLVSVNAEMLADTERRDNGKVTREVIGQIRYVSEYFHYYAGLADKIQGDVIPNDKPGVFTYTKYEPKGVVAIITPWNSPLNLTAWKLAPALAAGCTTIIKPSEFTSASILQLAALIEQAGFPPGVINVVTGYGDEVGQALVTHPLIAHVGFTGGDAAGRRIYELAARNLKTVTLELGGKSPNIVFDDADLDRALRGVAAGVFSASGQTCVAGSRLLVQESIHDAFVDRLVATMRSAKLGDPADPTSQIGPIATRPQFDRIVSMIEAAKKAGAKCVLGGRTHPELGAGMFVEPTIFSGVQNDMQIAQEEVFGPVLVTIPFRDEQHAVQIANDTAYGLAAGVWTRSLHRAMYVADRVKAGTVWVNNYRSSSFTAPFGGYKQSGLGRESGMDAVKEYLNTKCVWISSDLEMPSLFGSLS